MDRAELERFDREALIRLVLQQQKTLDRVAAEIADLNAKVGRARAVVVSSSESGSARPEPSRAERRACEPARRNAGRVGAKSWASVPARLALPLTRLTPPLAAVVGLGACVPVRPILAMLAVVAAALAIVVTPPPEWTAASGLAGVPRLVLYALSGMLFGLLAADSGLARRLHVVPSRRRAYIMLGLGLVASVTMTLVLVERLRRSIADPLGPLLWGVAMLLLLIAAELPEIRRIGWRALWPQPSDEPSVGGRSWLGPALVLLVLGVAAVTRLPALDRIPLGINPDEGDRAVAAFGVLSGQAPASWFDSGWYYINMIYFRVLAASFFLFGSDVAGGRMLSALVGIGFVAVVAWLGVRAFGWRIGLLAAAFAAGIGITLQHSRLITESGPTALLWALSIGGFLEGARTGRMRAWVLAGLTGGLDVYFYPSARLWAVGAVLTVVVLLVYQRDRRLLPGIAVAAIAALVASAPFLVHLEKHRHLGYRAAGPPDLARGRPAASRGAIPARGCDGRSRPAPSGRHHVGRRLGEHKRRSSRRARTALPGAGRRRRERGSVDRADVDGSGWQLQATDAERDVSPDGCTVGPAGASRPTGAGPASGWACGRLAGRHDRHGVVRSRAWIRPGAQLDHLVRLVAGAAQRRLPHGIRL